jgi:hypothetical protein
VPVAVVAAVGEQHDRRSLPEPVELVEERLPQVRIRGRAAAAEEDEQLASFAAALRHDEDLVQVPLREATMEREAFDAGAARAPITTPQVADADPADD